MNQNPYNDQDMSDSFQNPFDKIDNFDQPANNNSSFNLTRNSMKNSNIRNEELNLPVKNEAKSLEELSNNQESIDQLYQANLDKEWSLASRLVNRKMYDQVQEVKKELFKASAQYRLSFYKTMLDTRLDSLREKCNAGVKMIKGHYRHEVSSFLMSKMEQLSFEVKERQVSFLEMMKDKYAYAETLNIPRMKERYLNSIDIEEEKYLKFLDGLLDKFQSIVDEELQKYN